MIKTDPKSIATTCTNTQQQQQQQQHLVETTITRFEQTNLLAHPLHYHSFQSCSKWQTLRTNATSRSRPTCLVCQQPLIQWKDFYHCVITSRISSSSSSSSSNTTNDVLQCLACLAMVHRECAVRNHGAELLVKQRGVCSVNYQRIVVVQTDNNNNNNNVRYNNANVSTGEYHKNDNDNDDDKDTIPVLCEDDDNNVSSNECYVWSADGPPDHFWENQRSMDESSDDVPISIEDGLVHDDDDDVVQSNSSAILTSVDDQIETNQETETAKGTLLFTQANVVFGSVSNLVQNWFTANKDISNNSCTGTDNESSSPNTNSHPKDIQTMDPGLEICNGRYQQELSANSDNVEKTIKQPTVLAFSSIAKVTKTTQDMISAVKRVSFSYKHIGVVTAAGAGVGGVVGFAAAGPAGMITGVRVGSGVCQVMVAVDTIKFCVLGGGAIVGASHIAKEATKGNVKILAISNEVTSQDKVVLVRPYLEVNPEWENITRQAKKSAAWYIFLKSSLYQEYRKNDGDILKSDENEIEAPEKVFLLVSRSVNNKNSSPGIIYRRLLDEFFRRAKDDKCEDFIEQENERNCFSRKRRDDCHAVIHQLSLVLLEARPGLSSSSYMVEFTLAAVERLVFGEVYNSVFEEIISEFESKDRYFDENKKVYSNCHISNDALCVLQKMSEFVTPAEKMSFCIEFLEILCSSEDALNASINEGHTNISTSRKAMDTDSLLRYVCAHIHALPTSFKVHAEVGFMLEFCRDEYLLQGKEGYCLVTLQAALHFILADRINDLPHE